LNTGIALTCIPIGMFWAMSFSVNVIRTFFMQTLASVFHVGLSQ
jgi:hypothetical protein